MPKELLKDGMLRKITIILSLFACSSAAICSAERDGRLARASSGFSNITVILPERALIQNVEPYLEVSKVSRQEDRVCVALNSADGSYRVTMLPSNNTSVPVVEWDNRKLIANRGEIFEWGRHSENCKSGLAVKLSVSGVQELPAKDRQVALIIEPSSN